MNVLLDTAAGAANIRLHFQHLVVIAEQAAFGGAKSEQRLAIACAESGVKAALAVGREDFG
ncbi:MAG: hypothetical protein KAX36_09205 [Thermoflexales bacterium]|nr:hypothetical protein [Thermoflexales bacterium]